MSAGAEQQKGTADSFDAAPPAGSRHVSIEERRRLVAESLRIGNPGNNARNLPADADPRHECPIELRITDIRPYEHNPRRAGNAKFAEIKASIQSAGIKNPLTVTRRPGESHFIVESGGNTRLLAVQQLWAETSDSRFEKLCVLFRPWRSESHVLTAHMIENEQRGEMSFWDRANGIVAIKVHLEGEKGSALSLRQLDEALKLMGFATNPTTLSHYLFVTARLRTLGESIPQLSAQDVKTIQPRMNALKRHAHARAGISEATLYEHVLDPVVREAVDRYQKDMGFSAAQLCGACEAALAHHLGESIDELRRDLEATPSSAEDVARESCPRESAPAIGSVSTAPLADTGSARRSPAPVNGADTRPIATEPALPAAGQAPPPDACDSSALAAITDFAQRLAHWASVEEHLRLDPTAPLGFRTDEPPAPAQGPVSHARRVWWLLWHLSHVRPARESLPVIYATGDCSPAQGTHSNESNPADVDPVGAALLDWLLDPADALAGASLQFFGRIRDWRTTQENA